MQVTPASVRLDAASGANGISSNGGSDGDELVQSVVERGTVAHWEGFESLAHDILYRQARALRSCWLQQSSLWECTEVLCEAAQLGWEQGDEGSLLVAEPLFTSKATARALSTEHVE